MRSILQYRGVDSLSATTVNPSLTVARLILKCEAIAIPSSIAVAFAPNTYLVTFSAAPFHRYVLFRVLARHSSRSSTQTSKHGME